MFLTRVEMPWELARNPYDFHRQLWRLFPGESKETRRNGEDNRQGFLFRVEENATGRPARFMVQSRILPKATPGLIVLGTREFHPQPVGGQRLGFLLTANPIKTITDMQRETKPGKTSEKCRVPLIREADQRDWLARKLADAVEIADVSLLSHAPIYFRKGSRAGKLATVTYNGLLTVSHPDRLTELLENGVGPAKGFGCGLLLVRRVT